MPVMKRLTIGGVNYDTVGEASVTQVQTSGTKIATVSIDGTSTDLYAPEGGGGGSTVSVTQTLSSGTQVASIDVDGTSTTLYAPTPPTASSTTPAMDGTASAGSGTHYARHNHVHPTDTSRQETLVSGTNIKTVNGTSLLGSGDITTPTYTLPTASTSTLGGVKVDGSTITITDGVISSSGGGGGGYVTASGVLYAGSWETVGKTNYLPLTELATGSETVLVSPDPNSYSEYVSCGVRCYQQEVGGLYFVCTTIPTSNLLVNVIIFG